MTSVLVKDLKGKEVGKKELAKEIFEAEPNMHLVHGALVRQLANARSGSANSKTRSEVRGGGKKPWRQKGTGRARAGSIRSPLWAGGGVTFGPKPRDYSITMPKKARQVALRSVLALRANDMIVVQNFDGLFKSAPKAGEEVTEQPKTKQVIQALADLGLKDKSVTIILDRMAPGAKQVAKAARNICCVTVIDQSNINIKDIAQCDALLVTEQVLAELENRFLNKEKAAKTAPEAKEGKAPAKAKKADKAEEKAAPAKKAEPAKKATAKKSEESEEKAPKTTRKKKSEE